MNSKLLKKTVAVTTSVATTISLSGISLFAPIFVATAATIVEGDTVKTASNPDVYIVKYMGAKKFKRLILNPQVFESYKHLSWGAIKTVTQAEMDVFTVSELVRAVNDPKVYKLTSAANSDTGERHWVNMTAAEFVAAGNDWDSIYEINAVDRDNYTTASDVTPTGVTPAPVVPVGAGVTVSLASDSPAGTSVALGASNHAFAKINFAGGANTTVTSVVITRAGLAADADFSEIKLWDGATQIGGTQALNTVTHKATFTALGWAVPAGTTKVLTISGSLNTVAGGATIGNEPRLGIGAAADVVATTAVSGTFPAYGNSMRIAGIAVGSLNVTARTVPADSSPVAGATAVEIASWNFGAVTEGMSIRRIKVTQTGSASAADVKNVMLKVDGVQIGSTAASLASDGSAVFDLSSSPFAINAGVTKIVYLYADISSGIVTGATTRTIDFEITGTTDVTVFGANSAGSVTITTGTQAAYTTQSGVAQTVGQGTIPTVAVNGATNPSAQNFVRGTTQQLFSAFRFSNGVAQDVRIARLRLNLLGTDAGSVDISNVTLYKYDELTGVETQIGTATNFVGTVATYGADAPGLDTGIIDILKGKNLVLHVRADISTAASWTSIEIALNEVRIDGIQSQANMDPVVVTTVDGLGDVRTHGAHSAVGTLTVALAPSNPAAQNNIVPGKLGHEYIKVNLTANGEDITLSTLVFSLEDNATAAASGDFTNVKLWDGSTQVGSTVASPTSSATFSVNVTIKKDATKTFTVSADVPTNAATTTVWAGPTRVIGDFDTAGVFNSNLVATGVGSTASVTATSGDQTGLGMTALAETVTVAFQPLPSSTVVVSSSGVVITRAVLAAGNAGNVSISSMTFSLDDVTGVNTTSAANTSLGSIGLYDGATLLKSAVIVDGTPDTVAFTGLSITVPKGTQKVFDVKGNALVAGTFFTGFLDLTATVTDVVGTGLLSNATIYGTGANAANSGGLTISAKGELNVSVDAATPVASFVSVGTAGISGVDFAKFRFASLREAIDMEQLVVTLPTHDNTGTNNNDVANFASIQLFDGSAPVSSKVFPTGNNTSAIGYTFTFSPELRIPKDGFKVLTLKGDLNGTAGGANSTTTPKFHIADVTGDTDGMASNITARGVGSAQRLTSSAVGTNPETAGNVNAMTIVRSKPVFALCTASNCTKASPTGALLPGVTEVIRFRIAAEGDDVTFNSAANVSNIRFTIAQAGGDNAATRTATLYEVGKTASLQAIASINLTTAGFINFNAIATTISKDTFKEYYATVDLTDYSLAGETFRLSIEAADADVSWNDGVSADVTNTPSVTNLPVVGGTLVK